MNAYYFHVIFSSGGWTSDLMASITTPTHKPAFVVGPYLSPFCSPAMDCENLIAIASGIGVTPILSLIKKYVYTQRRLSLIWICRDAGLLEHFLNNGDYDVGEQGFILVYYMGKRSLGKCYRMLFELVHKMPISCVSSCCHT